MPPQTPINGTFPMPCARPIWNLLRRLFSGVAAAACIAPSAQAADFWSEHVEPILRDHCVECHSQTKAKSGLDLTTFQLALRGGDRGAGFVPGRPDDSNLVLFLKPGADPHMPPKRQLSDEQIELVRTGIEKLGVVKPAETVAAAPAAPAKPREPVWVPPPNLAASAVIDRFVELGWRERKVRPARPADDATFVRRVYLDLLGRIPTADEAEQFLANRERDRRAQLVDALLAKPEHARHLREVFDYVLMGRSAKNFEDQRRGHGWFDFLESSFRTNRPWDAVVRDLIVARPKQPEERGLIQFLYERQNNPQAMAEALAPVVFGVQIKCAQCHDHMVAREIKQAHYWGMVAAFNRTKNVDAESGPGLAESAIGGFVSFANLKKESQPARLVFFNGRSVNEAWPAEGEKESDVPEKYRVPPPAEKQKPKAPAEPKFSRREALADAVTRDNPLLARAMVNRVWAMLLGRGFVHPVDLMDSKHAPSPPDLLDWLAHDFERSGYDVRRLIRNVVLSRAYQLDSRPVGKVAPADEAFARALDKPLTAEQLYRSLLSATANPVTADGKVAGLTEEELRKAFVRQFPDLFVPDYNATLQQAMFLANSPLLEPLLAPRDGNLSVKLASLPDNPQRVKAAFHSVFGREPDREELKTSSAYLATHPGEPGQRQLLWALLTSTEFQVNH
jgi:mono/diheme cytochrome c family protein